MDDAEGTAAVRPAATVVTFPQEAVFSNAGSVRQRVASALHPGVRAVILDMTPTMFCDTSGLRELVIAHRLGHDQGVEMRVVVPSRLMRMITLTGLQGVLAIYPTLAAALTAGSASALASSPPAFASAAWHRGARIPWLILAVFAFWPHESTVRVHGGRRTGPGHGLAPSQCDRGVRGPGLRRAERGGGRPPIRCRPEPAACEPVHGLHREHVLRQRDAHPDDDQPGRAADPRRRPAGRHRGDARRHPRLRRR